MSLITGSMDPHYQLDLIEGLRHQDLQIDVIGGDSMAKSDVLKAQNVRFLNLRGDQNPRSPLLTKVLRLLTYYWRLIKYALETDARLFHIQWPNKFVYLDRTLINAFYKLLGKTVVLTAHNINAGVRDGNDSILNRLTLRCHYSMADHIIVHTSRLKKELIEDFGQSADKITVVRHGINNVVHKNTVRRDEAKAILGLSPENKTLLFFGHVKPYKGLEYLVDALDMLVRNGFPEVRLVLAGEVASHATYWNFLMNQIEAARLRDYVLLKIGFVLDDQIEQLFKAADCLVLPYRYSTQSGPLFIAYAYGLPVIAADIGSFSEDIKVGQTGFLFRAEDARDLCRTIKAFYQSELYSKLDHYTGQITRFAKANYSWDEIGRSTFGVYLRVMHGSAVAGAPDAAAGSP
jgi:D-inositol-3-phosphate glycosyltransferase